MTRARTTQDVAGPVARVTGLPRATVRLQLHRNFGFDAALARLPYFDALGISHLFVSPILGARIGSMHGYDVVDHGSVNAELGGEAGLQRLVEGLRARDMGLIVDVVPNHMAVGGHDNPRWLDVLEWGRDSRNADFFDIDWEVPDPLLHRRVLVPLLGAPYGEVLASGELALRCIEGRLVVAYHDHWFPVAPRLYAGLLAAPVLRTLAHDFSHALRLRGREARQSAFAAARESLRLAQGTPEVDAALAQLSQDHDPASSGGRARLHRLLERQAYRLAWWRSAADEINWRRFFDINELAALRIQEPSVFEAVHATTFRLYAAGLIDGLRVDHVDGLADPRAYCRQLRARLTQLASRRPPGAPAGPGYIVVEKILASEERLPQDWQVDGTSGYSFMNDVAAVLHDARGEPALGRIWRARHGRDYAEEERSARWRIPQELFAADFSGCALALHRIARSDARTRDWSLDAVRRVLLQLLVHFPVYRTYADRRGRSEADVEIMQRVVQAAEQTCRPGDRRLLHLIDRWLGGEAPRDVPGAVARRLRLRALARFQQLTTPVAAKAVEDTVFYRHARLLSRNEVGSDPSRFAIDVAHFHAICVDRQQRYPGALLATATHDHKRGEDVRMRLSVLSEAPAQWESAVTQWQALAAPRRGAVGDAVPDDTDEYIFYQMLVGTWPPGLAPDDAQGLAAFAARLVAWQRKAVREAKRHSGWVEPNLDYEARCERFIVELLDPARSADFLAAVWQYVQTIAPAGALKGLAQTLLRMTSPGLPDLYQGTEFWDFSMVDPDNRQPVDFARREQALARSEVSTATLLRDWTDGAIKQRLIARTLALRRRLPMLFAQGEYHALEVAGATPVEMLAYARTLGRHACIVIVPRLPSTLMHAGQGLRIAPEAWKGVDLKLPAALARLTWNDALERTPLRLQGNVLPLAQLLNPWPLALLSSG